MDLEMRELLKRHGMSESDVEAVAEFERKDKEARAAARKVKPAPAETLF